MSQEDSSGPDLVPMAVTGLMLDPSSNVPIVILRDLDRTLFLPIWIGVAEAQAIALRMEGVAPPRPLTHDLLLQMCQRLGGSIEKIVISDLREGTFFAEIHLVVVSFGPERLAAAEGARRSEEANETTTHAAPEETQKILDARPSDAIALALRAEVPIFVRRAVLDQAQVVATALDPSDDAERIRRVLEELNPNDPDRYTM